jgi:glycosyltransferase involved in cell wall biosynthesis
VLQEADVLALPSVRESGGGVILEAMAAGRPVIALNHGGPATLVDHGTGILITPRGERELIQDLADALVGLADHPKERLQMGLRGFQVASTEHLWSHRVETALKLYGDALQSRKVQRGIDSSQLSRTQTGGAR